MFIAEYDVFDFVLCSDKLSFHFLDPLSPLLNVFQYMVEVSFSGLFCRCLSLNVYSNPPVTYVSYLFSLNCGHIASKSTKNFYSKNRLIAFGRTCWKLNKNYLWNILCSIMQQRSCHIYTCKLKILFNC